MRAPAVVHDSAILDERIVLLRDLEAVPGRRQEAAVAQDAVDHAQEVRVVKVPANANVCVSCKGRRNQRYTRLRVAVAVALEGRVRHGEIGGPEDMQPH